MTYFISETGAIVQWQGDYLEYGQLGFHSPNPMWPTEHCQEWPLSTETGVNWAMLGVAHKSINKQKNIYLLELALK